MIRLLFSNVQHDDGLPAGGLTCSVICANRVACCAHPWADGIKLYSRAWP